LDDPILSAINKDAKAFLQEALNNFEESEITELRVTPACHVALRKIVHKWAESKEFSHET